MLSSKQIHSVSFFVLLWLFVGWNLESHAQTQEDSSTFTAYRGRIVDTYTHKNLEKVQVNLSNTNIVSITNADGEFLLKVPKTENSEEIRLTKVGYDQRFIKLSSLEKEKVISLTPSSSGEQLDQVELYKSKDPRNLVIEAIYKREANSRYLTGFYREGVTKGSGRNVMLAEAVLQVDQKRATAGKRGRVELYKSRKKTDYNKLDTTAIKLKGGPYNPMYSDVINYPEFLFYGKEGVDNFSFRFEEPTTFDGRYVFVVYFEDRYKEEPWYYGKIYIDAKTNALLKLEYHLNVENRRRAEQMLVAKKPRKYRVTPLEVNYEADYLLKDGFSTFNYGKFFIKIRVKKKGRLFNRRFSVKSELLITNREETSPFPKADLTRIRPRTIISDDVQGFGEEDFWGENNIIEPERSLERTFNTIWRRYQRRH